MYVCMYTCSRQMAEEVLRDGETGAEQNTSFEGMETLARAIELGMYIYTCTVCRDDMSAP